MEALAERMIEHERRGASRWFGFGVAVVPVLDRIDDAGWFTLLGDLARGHLEMPVGWAATLAWVVGFVALGFAASWVWRGLGRRDQWLFLGACVLTLGWYCAQRGVVVSVLVGGLALVTAIVRQPAQRRGA